MVKQVDRETAADLMSVSLDNIGITREKWLLELLFEEDTEYHELLRTRREGVGRHLEWKRPGRRKIPEEKIPSFIVDSLDIDILRMEKIRALLLRQAKNENSSNFISFVEYVNSSKESKDEISISELASREIRPGNEYAREFCKGVGLPTSFSIRGGADSRTSQEIVQSSKSLPDLVEFQQTVKTTLTKRCLQIPGGRGLVVMPTGSGKTRTMIESVLDWIIESQDWPPNIVWIADREELCEQAFQSFKEVFVNLTQKKRDDLEDRNMQVPSEISLFRYWGGRSIPVVTDESGAGLVSGAVVTSIQQLQAREKNSDWALEAIFENANFVIVDEAHRNIDYVDEMSSKLLESKNRPRMIGLTATPMRRDRVETAMLAEIFDSNFISPIEDSEHDIDKMIQHLTDDEILARRVDVEPSDIIQSNNYTGMSPEMESQSKAIQLIDEMMNRGCESILVFTGVVEDSRIIASCLRMRDNPVNAEHLEADTPIESRRRVIQNFRDGEVRVLLNYGILTTGFDAPKTDAVIICRPNLDKFDSLFQQMVGRGLRGPRFGGTDSCNIIHLQD